MDVKDITKQSGLSKEVAESLYWKCLWLRDAKPDTKVQWKRLLLSKEYRRCMKCDS